VTILRRIGEWIRARLLGPATYFNHWLPEDDSPEQWAVGAQRCFYCLTHRTSPSWRYRCPRRRPPSVEVDA